MAKLNGSVITDDPTPKELEAEINKLKTKTDNTNAELETVKKDVDEVKEKTKAIP